MVIHGFHAAHQGVVRIEGLLGGAVAFEVIGVFNRVAQGVRHAGEVVGGIVIIVRERGERGMR